MEFGERHENPDSLPSITQNMRASLGKTPDFAASILVAVDERRSFLSGRDRRRVKVIRWGLGISVAAVALAGVLLNRYAPQVVELVASPQPMSSMLSCMECETTSRVKTITANLRDVNRSTQTASITTLLDQIDIPVTATARMGADDEGISSQPAQASVRVTAGCFVGPIRPCTPGSCREKMMMSDRGSAEIQSSRETVRVIVRMRRDGDQRGYLAVEPPRMLWMSATPAVRSGTERSVSFRAVAPLAPLTGDEDAMIPK